MFGRNKTIRLKGNTDISNLFGQCRMPMSPTPYSNMGMTEVGVDSNVFLSQGSQAPRLKPKLTLSRKLTDIMPVDTAQGRLYLVKDLIKEHENSEQNLEVDEDDDDTAEEATPGG